MGSFSGSITKRFRILENQVINVKTLGAKGDRASNDAPFIQKALDMAFLQGGGTVLVPEGNYNIESKLYIRANTHLMLHQNARMLRKMLGSFLANYANADTLTNLLDPYSGHGNITIEGGIWDGNVLVQPYASGPYTNMGGFGHFSLTRGRDITFRNITFMDAVSGHCLDLAALDDVLVDNCNFLGYKDGTTDGSRNYAEAIQLAPFTKEGSGGAGDFSGKPVKNVTIQNCYFGDSGTAGMVPWAAGIGNHSSVHGEYIQDVNIINNTFDGMSYAGVRPFKYKNVKISGNTFKNCRIDIVCSADDGLQTFVYDPTTKDMIHADKEPQSGSNLNITENHFINSVEMTLYLRGWATTYGIGWWDNIRFTNNTFERGDVPDATGNAIQMIWARNVIIRDNQAIKNVSRGVVLYNCANATVENNRIERTQYEGIYVSELDDTFRNQGKTGLINIRNNSLDSILYQGIYMAYVKGGTVKGNRLRDIAYQSDNSRDAIYLYSSDDIEIDDNYISSKQKNRPRYGIGINNNCNYCRVGSNYIVWTATAPFVAGGTNWTGDYTINTTNVLWSGNNQMGEFTPGTVVEVTPSKKLSECRNGWILIWSDWNATAGDENYDWNHSVIQKYMGNVRSGQKNNFPIANYLDGTIAKVTVKTLSVYDDKLKGHADNTVTGTEAYDVTLRQVLEW